MGEKKPLSKDQYREKIVKAQLSGDIKFSILRLTAEGLNHSIRVKVAKSIATEILCSIREGCERFVVFKHSSGFKIGHVQHVDINPVADHKQVAMRWAHFVVPESPQFYREHKMELEHNG